MPKILVMERVKILALSVSSFSTHYRCAQSFYSIRLLMHDASRKKEARKRLKVRERMRSEKTESEPDLDEKRYESFLKLK